MALAIAGAAWGGWSGLVVGYFLSTVRPWHSTFLVNPMAHLWGNRRYPTRDSSRNDPLVALLTLGEGWHNNHHHMPTSARQGVRWWEIDVTYRVLPLHAGRRGPRGGRASRRGVATAGQNHCRCLSSGVVAPPPALVACPADAAPK